MILCLNCDRPQQHHGENLLCVGTAGRAGKKFSTMDRPDGRTCGDCHHVHKCCSIFGSKVADTSCRFFPIRFRLPEGKAVSA